MKFEITKVAQPILFAWLISAGAVGHPLDESEYDEYFAGAEGVVPAEVVKAMCYQESAFDASAVSPAGAQGLCQFMPATWREMKEKHKEVKGGVFDPEASITLASRYIDKMYRVWTAPRTEASRVKLALASYNAGVGNLLRAQKMCGGATEYEDIIRCLPLVTGSHAEETVKYVENIWYKWLPRTEIHDE